MNTIMQNVNETGLWMVTEPEIMALDKYLSATNAPDLEEDTRLCIASGARDMIFDCSELGYMTGAGARAFLTIAKMMSDAGGKMSVANLNGQPRELFTACGLDLFIPTASDVTASLTAIRAA